MNIENVYKQPNKSEGYLIKINSLANQLLDSIALIYFDFRLVIVFYY